MMIDRNVILPLTVHSNNVTHSFNHTHTHIPTASMQMRILACESLSILLKEE